MPESRLRAEKTQVVDKVSRLVRLKGRVRETRKGTAPLKSARCSARNQQMVSRKVSSFRAECRGKGAFREDRPER